MRRSDLQRKMMRKGAEVRLPLEVLEADPKEIIDLAGDIARETLKPLKGTSLEVTQTDTHMLYRLPRLPQLPTAKEDL